MDEVVGPAPVVVATPVDELPTVVAGPIELPLVVELAPVEAVPLVVVPPVDELPVWVSEPVVSAESDEQALRKRPAMQDKTARETNVVMES